MNKRLKEGEYMKVRVHELAKKYDIKNKEFLEILKKDIGITVTSHLSNLDEDQVIMDWCADLNSKWENYTLAGMDIGTDSFVIMVLSYEEFKTAQELAKELLHRIDVAERS